MKNLETKKYGNLVESIESQLDAQEIILKKRNEKLLEDYKKSIDESKIKDSRIKTLLKEKSTAEGTYAEKIDTLLHTYLSEQKEKGKLGIREEKRINKLLEYEGILLASKKEEDNVTKQLNRKESLVNPLEAIKFAFEDYKEKRKDNSFKESFKEGSKTLGSGLLESTKQQFTLKNLSKSILHGVGVALDLPALNILASNINSDIKQRQDDNVKMLELTDSLVEAGNDSEVLSKAKEFTSVESEKLSKDSDTVQNIINLENLEKITKEMHDDLSEELISIFVENSDLNKMFKEYMYFQRDLADDMKNTKKDEVSSLAGAEITAKEEEPPSLLDDLFGLGGTGKGKGSKAGKTSKMGKYGKTSKMGKYGKFAKVGGGVLAALTSGVMKYMEVSDDETLSTSQKTTQVGATATGAGAGALGGAALGASIGSVVPGLGTLIGGLIGGAVGGFGGSEVGSMIGDFASGLIGDKQSTSFVNQLEKQGILETSMFGDSEIKNWDVVASLNDKQLGLLLKYDDWGTETTQRLKGLQNYKVNSKASNVKSNTNSNGNTNSMLNSNTDKILNSSIPKESPTPVQQPVQQMVQAQQPTSSGSRPENRKIDSFKMEEVELRKYMMDRGLL